VSTSRLCRNAQQAGARLGTLRMKAEMVRKLKPVNMKCAGSGQSCQVEQVAALVSYDKRDHEAVIQNRECDKIPVQWSRRLPKMLLSLGH